MFSWRPFPFDAPGVCHRQSCHSLENWRGHGHLRCRDPGSRWGPSACPPTPSRATVHASPSSSLHWGWTPSLQGPAPMPAGFLRGWANRSIGRDSGRGGAGAGTFIPPLPCVGVAVGCCVPWLKVTAPDRQPSPELLGTTPSPDAADLRAGEGSRWVLHNPGVSRTLCPQLCKLCLCTI